MARLDYTPVADQDPAQPQEFALLQNFPNPFNLDTAIRFDLPQDNLNARVEIYNLKGERVRVLLDARHPAGSHQLRWDGRDDSGNTVSSGVYLCRLMAGSFAATRRLILLK
ncbi:T9SS type A sorting domain-containing protein [candidate division KSB1 bacterium]|nr:T9SS type A sorting domain-containing protein [candidate division KSB1 bacterium]